MHKYMENILLTAEDSNCNVNRCCVMPIKHLALVFIRVSEVIRGSSESHSPGITPEDALCHLSYLWQPPESSIVLDTLLPEPRSRTHKVERSCWRWLTCWTHCFQISPGEHPFSTEYIWFFEITQIWQVENSDWWHRYQSCVFHNSWTSKQMTDLSMLVQTPDVCSSQDSTRLTHAYAKS